MKKIIFTLFFCAATFASQLSFAQTTSNSVSEASPNLPEMVRYDNIGNEYHGINHSYKTAENEAALKEWATAFPEEVIAYKEAMEAFLKTDYSTLSDSEKETYDDLKSQWLMFSQL